jgi:beta-1,2-mannobiose phosphorylase / 1,2-beta-oligomannan phosphorylase
MYYGVGRRETVRVYRTSWALPDLDDPRRILRLEDEQPVLEANPIALISAHIRRLHHRRGRRR